MTNKSSKVSDEGTDRDGAEDDDGKVFADLAEG